MNKIIRSTKYFSASIRSYSTKTYEDLNPSTRFETVFSLSAIKYFALINRLKVYHAVGTAIAVPSSGLLEMLCIVPSSTFVIASYIGVTGIAVLSMVSVPFRNIIGFLYISEDNKQIKISSVDFWGKRINRIVKTDDWIPLHDMPPSTMDAIYLSPQLADGTKYKLLVKFGKVLNASKMGQALE